MIQIILEINSESLFDFIKNRRNMKDIIASYFMIFFIIF